MKDITGYTLRRRTCQRFAPRLKGDWPYLTHGFCQDFCFFDTLKSGSLAKVVGLSWSQFSINPARGFASTLLLAILLTYRLRSYCLSTYRKHKNPDRTGLRGAMPTPPFSLGAKRWHVRYSTIHSRFSSWKNILGMNMDIACRSMGNIEIMRKCAAFATWKVTSHRATTTALAKLPPRTSSLFISRSASLVHDLA
uniref:Uncharacterized protein n=1 Tax=Candidatus Kentrum sp. TUN TaxID=2126343 RepID=A0A451ADF8_9GAMM|nr:MAG: hypothetical protein BECKTUN1418F_GA0071002_10976 [Candidatus Kentron sp. TUN]VFK59213.1 MAG: hypothetical protein BECKTUN1418D_GA0071000_10974 [Candidatus Kentron sp. TUN]VFK64055.1 MAG: hypothetical protein BECKTUN1418E_GA0071001_10946 [Candidatus Kentron sp. TUN]